LPAVALEGLVTATSRVELRVIEGPPSPGELYQRYSAYVAALGYRLLGRDGDVDDLVQDVFLAAVEGLGSLREAGALKGWLATLTVRLAGRKLRRRRIARFFGFDGSEHDIAAPGATPEERALLGQVYEALEGVGVDARLAWVLRNIEGEPLDQVAKLCGCSLATAKRRIAAAHADIERRLS
jgi:RNA polymerase sigma-70 factor (ECF subfamily)